MSGRRERGAARAITRTSWFMRLAAVFLRTVLRIGARVHLEGGRDLPRSGPLILVSNHTSNADPPLLGAWLQPRLGRPVQFMAKEQLFIPALRPLLSHFGAILVRAGGSDADAYRDALAVLRGGGVVGIFPEGTRSLDGSLGQPHPGAALIAARAGVPILPVGISGAHRFLRRNARLPAFGARITIRVGEPFTLAPPERDRRAATEAGTAEIMRRLAALIEPDQRGRWA
ncbi:MAG: lysophospholipid acyltransferase family protein [Candidatus Limnocylindrales bacterium]